MKLGSSRSPLQLEGWKAMKLGSSRSPLQLEGWKAMKLGSSRSPLQLEGWKAMKLGSSRSPPIRIADQLSAFSPYHIALGLRLSGILASRLPGLQALRLPGIQTSKLPGLQASRPPGFPASRLPGLHTGLTIPSKRSANCCSYQLFKKNPSIKPLWPPKSCMHNWVRALISS